MKLKNSETEQRRGRSRIPEVESDNRWPDGSRDLVATEATVGWGCGECGQSMPGSAVHPIAPTVIVHKLYALSKHQTKPARVLSTSPLDAKPTDLVDLSFGHCEIHLLCTVLGRRRIGPRTVAKMLNSYTV